LVTVAVLYRLGSQYPIKNPGLRWGVQGGVFSVKKRTDSAGYEAGIIPPAIIAKSKLHFMDITLNVDPECVNYAQSRWGASLRYL
jgi:hypothetical protein